MRNSIRSRLTISFIGVAIGPLLLVGVVLASLSFVVQYRQALSRESTVVQSVSGQVNSFFQRLEGELGSIVKTLQGTNGANANNILARLPSFPDVFQTVILLDNQGQELAHIDRLQVVAASDKRDWSADNEFKVPLTTHEIYYGPVTINELTGEPSITISVPIINPRTGNADQILTSSVRFKPVWDLIAGIKVDDGEQIYLVSESKRVIAHLNPSIALRYTEFTPPNEDGLYTGLNGSRAIISTNTIEPASQAALVQQAAPRTFIIVAEKDWQQALSLAFQTVIVTVVLLVVALLLATTQGILAARPIVRPIRQLAGAAEAIRVKTEGFDPKTLEPLMTRGDELGQLARVFQSMGSEVKTREQDLKQQVQKLKIEIDEAKKDKQVAEITETDMFKDLQEKARRMRARSKGLDLGASVVPGTT